MLIEWPLPHSQIEYARLTLRLEALANLRSNNSIVVSLPSTDVQLRG